MKHILKLVEAASTIAIGGHVRPDGDSVGSCMALYGYLRKLYKEKDIHVYLEKFSDAFTFLKRAKDVEYDVEVDKEFDLFISLDCGSVDRLGFLENAFQSAKSTINIDHHISNENFGEYNYVEADASSTCEVLFGLMEFGNVDKDIAEALYLGIVHDTGVFKHSNTTRKTMEAAGLLIEKGVSSSKIIDESFYKKTYMQNQVMGRCLLESILVLDGKCIVSCISRKTMGFYQALPKDLDGIIDQLRVTKGIEVAIFLYELENGDYKVSMRSNNIVDVSKISQFFGGGGHIRAAGCTMNGTYYDVINNLTEHIESQLNQ